MYSAARDKVTVTGNVFRPSWTEQKDMQAEWNTARAESDGHSTGLHAVDAGTVKR